MIVTLERKASRLRESVAMPSYLTVPSVKMQRSRASVSVDFPEPVRPTINKCQIINLWNSRLWFYLFLRAPLLQRGSSRRAVPWARPIRTILRNVDASHRIVLTEEYLAVRFSTSSLPLDGQYAGGTPPSLGSGSCSITTY